MVTINLAYTTLINPPGSNPTLTQSQVWAGLKRKVLRPQDFVPVITACDILSSINNNNDTKTVVRNVTFSDGRVVRETCVSQPPSREDFRQDETGSMISNIVSRGPGGELMMTFSFSWVHMDVEEGGEEHERKREEHERVAKMATEGTVETIRRLVREAEI